VLGGNCAFDKRVVEFDGQERVFCESRGTAEEGFCDKLLTPCDPSDIGTNGNCCGVDTLPDGSPGGRLVCQRASDALRLLYDYCNLAGGPLDVIPPPVAKLSLDLADKISGPVCSPPLNFRVESPNFFADPPGYAALGGVLGTDVIRVCGEMMKPFSINLENLGT